MSNINKSRGKTKPLGYVKEMCGILKKKSTQNKPQTQNYKKINFSKKYRLQFIVVLCHLHLALLFEKRNVYL